MREQRYAQAEEPLESLSATVGAHESIHPLHIRINFYLACPRCPSIKILEPSIARFLNDLQARCRLSAVQIMREDCDSAMEQLLEIVRRDDGDDRAGHMVRAI